MEKILEDRSTHRCTAPSTAVHLKEAGAFLQAWPIRHSIDHPSKHTESGALRAFDSDVRRNDAEHLSNCEDQPTGGLVHADEANEMVTRYSRLRASLMTLLFIVATGYAGVTLAVNTDNVLTQESALALREVVGPKLITQRRALVGGITTGDAPGFPITITEPGSYRLASDIQILSDLSQLCRTQSGAFEASCAIEILTNHVTVDFDGFSISGLDDDGILTGMGVLSWDYRDITLKNGTLHEFLRGGAVLGDDSRIIDMRLISAGTAGAGQAIIIRDGCTVVRNTISDGEPEGAAVTVAGSACLIADNTIFDYVGQGIRVHGSDTPTGAVGSCTIARNTVERVSFGSGIGVDVPCTITDNIVRGGDFNGIVAADGSVLRGNVVEDHPADGIVAGDNCVVVDNSSNNNGNASDIADGIRFGIGCTVKANTANHNSGNGINGSSNGSAPAGSTVIANTANFNGGDGIRVAAGSTVKDNTATRNGDDGIETGANALVLGNNASGNTNFGLRLTVRVGYGHNVLADNNGPAGNNNPQVFSGIEIGTNVCGVDTTCP